MFHPLLSIVWNHGDVSADILADSADNRRGHRRGFVSRFRIPFYRQSMRLRVIYARCGLGNILQYIIDLKA
jgi:hypothetical protein